MRALILTNEFPPNVYGGAGVHVEYLARELSQEIELDIRTFGQHDEERERLRVRGYPPAHDLSRVDERLGSALGALSRDVGFLADPVDAHLVHCHTWYTHLAGILVRLAHGIPLVITAHSLEPLRPWKREQLGGGYEISAWVERSALELADAVIAVSSGGRDDILRLFDVPADRVHVIHNGIDTDEYRPTSETEALERHGIDSRVPYVLFVGRITRQKGVVHLIAAARHFDPGIGLVLVAGQPDTPELARAVEAGVDELRKSRPNVVWIPQMLDRPTVRQLYSHAAVFCCPSVYEPFGIINLEAMACQTPVVASAVGGIPEVVVDGETGFLVPFEATSDGVAEPAAPEEFARALADRINPLVGDRRLRTAMGEAGRRRAVDRFSWRAVARQTLRLYRSLAGR